MPAVLKYKDGASYVPLYGGSEEVTISPNQPPIPTDLWLDTDDDTSYPENTLSGFRNVIRNGDMGISQRGDGPFTVSANASLDGWVPSFSGGTSSVSRVALAPGTASAKYALSTSVSGQAAAGDFFVLQQRTEGVETFSGQVATLSFVAKASTGTPKIGIELEQRFGTTGSPSATVLTAIQAVTISTTRTRYSVTFTVPSVVGKTLTTADSLVLTLWMSAGSNYAARSSGIGIQNAVIEVTEVQLEAGPIATPFERLPVQQQLAWCQRFFYRNQAASGGNGHSYFAQGINESTTSARVGIEVPVPMRSIPTVSFTGNIQVESGGAGSLSGTTSSSIASWYSSATGKMFADLTTPALLNKGYTCFVYINAGTSNYIDFAAEL